MTGLYLERILPAVQARLEERKRRQPLHELESRLESARLRLARPSFTEALQRPGISLIAEVKRRSPSKGPIHPELDVASLVRSYGRGGARAISVLTEEDHFGGSLADLERAAAVSPLPILRKDFIIDEYQIVEAAVHGASAVLLIAALLPGDRARVLSDVATGLALDVLLEVHDEDELDRAVAVTNAVIGINNRDLRTFDVSLAVTGRLMDRLPSGRIVVSESGIWTRDDIALLEGLGVDAVLVGESLLRSPNVERATAELLSLSRRAELPLRIENGET